jgi:acetyl esterase
MTYERGDTPLHPVVATLLQTLVAGRAGDTLDYNAQRQFDDMMVMAFNADLPALAVEEEIMVPGPAGDMRALVFSAAPRDGGLRPVVLHLHGGGFVIAKPETTARVSKAMATEGDSVVVSLDYRRSPEAVYPAALDDVLAAYRWLRGNAATIGGDPKRVGVAGDSAGGNLAAAMALRLIAEGEAPPDAVVLVCAWLDLTMSSPSSRRFGPDDPAIYDAMLAYWRDLYAPGARDLRDPLLSPLFGDVSSFPPTCIIAGNIDPFVDEDAQFAEKLRAAGRDVELYRYDGMPHWFTMFPQVAPLTDWAQRIGAFLTRTLGEQAIAAK